jgi:hypothetical protein
MSGSSLQARLGQQGGCIDRPPPCFTPTLEDSMKAHHHLFASAVAACFALPAQSSVVIDDFSTGSVQFQLTAAPAGDAVSGSQLGAMASGSRYAWLGLYGPTAKGGQLNISASGLDFREDLGATHRMELLYGTPNHPMHLDLSGESHLRFAFADAPLGLNFNVLLYYRGEVGNYSQLGVNIAPHADAFNVDFAFTDFADAVQDKTRPADFSAISTIWVITQSGAFVNGW